jgi:hypothetical protein
MLDECFGLLASTQDRAWTDRRTLADIPMPKKFETRSIPTVLSLR